MLPKTPTGQNTTPVNEQPEKPHRSTSVHNKGRELFPPSPWNSREASESDESEESQELNESIESENEEEQQPPNP